MERFKRAIGIAVVVTLVASTDQRPSRGEVAAQLDSGNTDPPTIGYAPGRRFALVPAACTGTDEPELEIRALPHVDPIEGWAWSTRTDQIHAMGFGSPTLGLAIMRDHGPLTYTANGGHTWHSLGKTAAPHDDDARTGVEIAFVNDQVGWAIGRTRLGSGSSAMDWRAVATFDGGLHWHEYLAWVWRWQPMAQMLAGTHVHNGRWRMPDGAYVSAAYASTDDGRSWFALPAPSSQAEAVRTVRHYDRLMLFGEQNLFISASDLDFPVVDTPWWDLDYALQKLTREIRFGMTREALHDLTDSRAYWAFPPTYGTGSRPYQNIRMRDEDHVPSYLLRTEDGGQTWHEVPLALPFDAQAWLEGLAGRDLEIDIYDIAMVDDMHGWMTMLVSAHVPGEQPEGRWENHIERRTFCTGDGAGTWHLVQRSLNDPTPDDIGLLWYRGGYRNAVFALDYRHIWFPLGHRTIVRIAPIEDG